MCGFEIECIDRMHCNVYVPQLQYAGGLIGYLQRQLGLPIASTAPLAKITDAFSAAVRSFARVNAVPWVDCLDADFWPVLVVRETRLWQVSQQAESPRQLPFCPVKRGPIRRWVT